MNFCKWISIIFLFTTILVFTSCIQPNDEDIQSLTAQPTVFLGSIRDQKAINTPYGQFYAQGSSVDTLKTGDCGLSDFTIDFNNQPAGTTPFLVNVSNWVPIDKYELIETSGSMKDDYKDSISSISPTILMNKILFFVIGQKAYGNLGYIYEMLYNIDSISSDKNIPIYLKSKQQGSKADSDTLSIRNMNVAFDISMLFLNASKDTVKLDLFYQTSLDEKGNPIYKPSSNNPYSIILSKNSGNN